ncbi:hypothetical protein PISMIDRAFT_440399 [Pisolithus microcarpus 441]|uniref:Uncharacterized protein n=1 Tax=Pisolithus microcarpus 441 TaxID=765257 RepID=A0A0D0A5N6_9AGAM|nr:hypothetical protein PISMIDRAFT_440399 [Pisolithus microcarpus 441]
MVAGKERDFSGYCNRCIASHLSQWNSRGLNAFATYEGCVVCTAGNKPVVISIIISIVSAEGGNMFIITTHLASCYTGRRRASLRERSSGLPGSVVCVGHRNKSPIICVVVLTTSEMGGAMWNFQSSYEIRVNEVQRLRFMGMKIQCHLRHDKGGLDAKSSSGGLRGL